jgi:arylsulfatase A-like enzyme
VHTFTRGRFRGRRWRWLLIAVLAIMAAAAARALWHRDGLEIADPAPFTADVPEVRVLREAAAGANLVICVIDAARADHVGCYGYPRDATPNIDEIAQESLVFGRHFAQYAMTKPSTASLFTSQHADTHLAYESRPLLEGTFTAAKGLEAAGFATVMFSSNPNAAPATGLGLDFQEVYDQTDVEPLVDGWEEFTLPQPLLSLIESWLEKNARRRFFAYVHFDPPHQPYLQPDEMTQMFAGQRPPTFVPGRFEFPVGDRELLGKSLHPPLPEWINLYDANLRFADWAVGELVRLLQEADVFEKTVLVVSADHGEAFGEHGYLWHERGVYDELMRVPLVLRLPGGAGAREIAGLTQTIDLLPTVFDLFEVPYPRDGIQGTSLLSLMAGTEDKVHDYVIVRSDGRPPSYLVRGEEWALILWGNGQWRALYDLRRDPGQRSNVIEDHPEVAEEMLAEFGSFAMDQRRPPLEFLDPEAEPVPVPAEGALELSPEDRRRLRALGYVK